MDLDEQQRMASEIEEVVVRSHRLSTQDLLPDLGHATLDLARGHAGPGGPIRPAFCRRGKRRSVHLPASREGQARERHEGPRHHVLRQAAAKVLPKGGPFPVAGVRPTT